MKRLFLLVFIVVIVLIAACKAKNYNNHLRGDSPDSISVTTGKAMPDSTSRLEGTSPLNNDSSGGQTGSMSNAPGKDTIGKNKK